MTARPINADQIVVDAVDAGWWDESGMHDAANPTALAGSYRSTQYRDFFVFELYGVTQRVTGATFRFYNQFMSSSDPVETYTLFDVATPVAVLSASGSGQTDIFTDLGSGSSYGARDFSPADNLTVVDMPLNTAAIAALNQSLARQFALGGAVTSLDHLGQEVDEFVSPGGRDSLTELVLDVVSHCGNGVVDPGEECDDGNTDPADGCTNFCTICGNGVVTAPEVCDDGNLINGDGCDADCAVAPLPPTPTPTTTNTPSPTCAPTGTPYCSNQCPPSPTIAPGCFAPGGGPCFQNPQCASNEACAPNYLSAFCCSCATLTPTSTPTNTSTNTPTPSVTRTVTPSCTGDCNGDGSVTVDELITLVNVALGNAQASACPHGVPSGAEVNVVLIIQAVNKALNGCGG